MQKRIPSRLNGIELRLGRLGFSGGGYPVYSPLTTVGEILDELEDDYKECTMLWKDWRQTVQGKNNLFYSKKNPQYPLDSLWIHNYPRNLTLFLIIESLYEKYGEPINNHTCSIIKEIKIN